jgi:hypothetical protein
VKSATNGAEIAATNQFPTGFCGKICTNTGLYQTLLLAALAIRNMDCVPSRHILTSKCLSSYDSIPSACKRYSLHRRLSDIGVRIEPSRKAAQ